MHGHFVFQRDFFFAHNLLTGVSRSTRNEKLQCFCCGLFVYLAKNRCKDQFNTSQQATFTQQEASHTLISQEIVLKKLEKYNNLIRFRFYFSQFMYEFISHVHLFSFHSWKNISLLLSIKPFHRTMFNVTKCCVSS